MKIDSYNEILSCRQQVFDVSWCSAPRLSIMRSSWTSGWRIWSTFYRLYYTNPICIAPSCHVNQKRRSFNAVMVVVNEQEDSRVVR